MRLGKTLPVVRFLKQCHDANRILVVGPYSVLSGWKEHVPESYVINGNSKERDQFFSDTADIGGWFLINKEAHLYVDFLRYGWDAIIIDESFITNPQAKVTNYFIKNSKAKYRIILSGTPAPESELQYFTQLQWINPVILGHKNFWEFRAKRFRAEGFDLVMPFKEKKWLAERLAKYCSILSRKDVKLNKAKIYETRKVILTKDNRRKYRQIEEDAMLGDDILKFAGQRWNELRRICSGQEKIDELINLLYGELKGKQVVIYAWYVEEVDWIATELQCPAIHGVVSKDDRESIRNKFQKSEFYHIVIQPETMKFGSCFSSADAAVFFSRPSSLLTNQQVEERTEDLSTPDSTLIVDLVAENSIDEDILVSIKLKESRVAALDRIRRAVENRKLSRI